MDKELIQTTANYLYQAEKDKIEVQKITAERISGLTISEAYLIQDELIKVREQDGHKVIAKKMGLTSKAKWECKLQNDDTAVYDNCGFQLVLKKSHKNWKVLRWTEVH